MDKHGFLHGPGLGVYLLMNSVKLVGVHGVSCCGAVEMYGGGDFKMFLNPFPQGPARFPNGRNWGSWCVGIGTGKWCLFGWLWDPCPWGCPGLFWVCWSPWSGLEYLFFCIVSWTCLLFWGCMGPLWWFCSCCCWLDYYWCWWCWKLVPGWDGWTGVATGWGPRQGTGSGGGLFWCVVIPCPSFLELKTLFWPCVLGCWRHFVWL